MEEKKSQTPVTPEKIMFLTFNPQQLLNTIEEQKEYIRETQSELNFLKMMNLDLTLEIERRMTWKELWYEFVLKLFGDCWE